LFDHGMTYDVLDDAYDRLRSTGPEFDGWLANHGPMAAEALARHGHEEQIPAWLDSYCRRLEVPPGLSRRIDDWRTALGDPRRLGDWLRWFEEQLREQPWTSVLHTWWPRLVPGIAAGATHGVIRVGHAVRVLREQGETPARVAELGQGLGYWAARWQPVPGATSPGGSLSPEAAVAALPMVPHQVDGIWSRLAQLDHLDGWAQAQRAVAISTGWEEFLREVVNAAVRRYATHAHGSPVMLVHAATAPNAVLRVLPSLPHEQWAASAAAAWSASAAIHAAYTPPTGAPPHTARTTAADAFDRASQHGDEHVIKLADTALDTYAWTGDDLALAAVQRAALLIDPA
jgi:hypothetical protein